MINIKKIEDSFNKLQKDLRRAFKRYEPTFVKNLRKRDKEIVESIQERTRAGLDYKKKKFKPLKNRTIAKRIDNKNLSNKTTPATSNLTETGRMLDDLKVKKTKYGFEISVPDDRVGAAEGNEEMGRVFLALSEDENKIIEENIEAMIDEVLKNFIK